MSRRRLTRQNSGSKYDHYNFVNDRSVVDIRSRSNNERLTSNEETHPDYSFFGSGGDIENSGSGGGGGGGGSGDNGEQQHQHQQKQQPRRLTRQNSSSKYDHYNFVNDRSVVDIRSRSNNERLTSNEETHPDFSFFGSGGNIENTGSGGGGGGGGSGDNGEHQHQHQQKQQPRRSFKGEAKRLLSNFSRHSNMSFDVGDISDCSSSSSSSSSDDDDNGNGNGTTSTTTNRTGEEQQEQSQQNGNGTAAATSRRPSLKRNPSSVGGSAGGSFRGLVKQLSWKNNSTRKVYNEYEHDDKFLDVCRLDEERSKLIGLVEEPNMIKLLTHWTGTIFAEIIYDYVFWATLLLYIILRIWIDTAQHNATSFAVEIEEKAKVLDSLPIVGGFLTLFLVFFVNQNHARYYSLHDSTMKIMGSICDLAALLASSPNLPIERARRINRYCNAAHVVMYAGLTRYLQEGQIVEHLTRDYALLTDEETSRMEICGMYEGKASACFELLSWSLQDVNRALGSKMLDEHQASEMRTKIIDFRSTVAQIVVTCLCPIPFFYVHFLSLLTAIYLPLFALMVSFKTGDGTMEEYKMTWWAEIVGFLLVVLQCLFIIGLRILGQQLGNPYGEDFIDMQITTYIIMVLSTSNRTLESMDVNDIYHGKGNVADPDTELQLKMEMVNLGDAWGIKKSKSSPSSGSSTTSSHRHYHSDVDDDDDDDTNNSNSHGSSNKRNSSNSISKKRDDENNSNIHGSSNIRNSSTSISSSKNRDDEKNSPRSSSNRSYSSSSSNRARDLNRNDHRTTLHKTPKTNNRSSSNDDNSNIDYQNLQQQEQIHRNTSESDLSFVMGEVLMGSITDEERQHVLGGVALDDADKSNTIDGVASIVEGIPSPSALLSRMSCGAIAYNNSDVPHSTTTDHHSNNDDARQPQQRHRDNFSGTSSVSITSSVDQLGTVSIHRSPTPSVASTSSFDHSGNLSMNRSPSPRPSRHVVKDRHRHHHHTD